LIRRFDVYGFNGLYHEIDTLLNPIPTQTIPDVVRISGLNLLYQALIDTGANVDLSSNGPWTLFAPNDDAMKAANTTNLGKLRSNLFYHVVGGIIEFPSNGTITPSYPSQLNNQFGAELLNFTKVINNSIIINGMSIILSAQPLRATNGLIYVIDRFLTTSVLQDKPIAQTLLNSGLTTTLMAYNITGLLDTLTSGDLTLFAPTNEAWESNLPLGLTKEQLFSPSNSATLRSILLYQLSASRLTLAFLRTGVLGQIPTLLGGESITVTRLPNVILLNGAEFVLSDIVATNGYIHSINRVIYPNSILPKNLWETLQRDPSFSGFVSLIARANLQNLLQDANSNYTLFIPSNAALNVSAVDDSHLVDIIKYHFVPNIFYSDALKPPLGSLPTVQGSSVLLRLTAAFQILVNTATVTRVDIKATNGVIHVVNQLLIPSNIYPTTVIDVIKTNGLTTFADLIDAAELTNILTLVGPYTLLAPSNKAFSDLDSEFLASLRNDKPSLRNLIFYHVLSNVYNTNSLPAGNVQTNMGQNVTVIPSAGEVRINGSFSVTSAVIINGNLLAQNGIVHVIDHVLLPSNLVPKTVMDVLAAEPRISDFNAMLYTYKVSDLVFGKVREAVTFFAPTNDAIKAAVANYPQYFNSSSVIYNVLTYHTAIGFFDSSALVDGRRISTNSRGEIIQVKAPTNTTILLNNAGLIIDGDKFATSEFNNGVVHIIDQVLFPPYVFQNP